MKDIRLRKLIYGDTTTGLRKWTTPIHWGMGALFATISTFLYFPAGLALLVLFAIDEKWNDQEEIARNPVHLPEGCTDWWESWAVYVGYLAVATVPLNLAGIIVTRFI